MYHIATNTPDKPKSSRTFSDPTTLSSDSSEDESFLLLNDSYETERKGLAEIEIVEDNDYVLVRGIQKKSIPALRTTMLGKVKRALNNLHLPLTQRENKINAQFPAEELPSPAFSVEIGPLAKQANQHPPEPSPSDVDLHKDAPKPVPRRFRFNQPYPGFSEPTCQNARLANIRRGIMKLRLGRRARRHVRKDMEGVFQDDYQQQAHVDAFRMPLLD